MNDANEKKDEIKKVCCGRCGYMIALESHGEVSIRIDEIYVYIFGGAAILICKGCGASNLVATAQYEKDNAGAVDKLLWRVNHVRAQYEAWKSRKERQLERTQLENKGEKQNV